MPERWKASLEGMGEIDLRSVKVLSETQLLWSTGGLGSEIASFFASKALNSRVQKLDKADYPFVLKHPHFKGHAYRLEEVVLDTPSLVEALAKPHLDSIVKINPNGYQLCFYDDNPQHIDFLTLNHNNIQYQLEAKRYIFAAGEGNEKLIHAFAQTPEMQRRPLHMVIVKLNTAYPFFAHCIDHGMSPRVTITTHPTKDGKMVWYIGGQIAEEGMHRTQAEQIEFAKEELHTLFPWLDFSTAEWASFFVNRAEAKQAGGKRPETFFVHTRENVMIAWPTKLALTPLLSDELTRLLEQDGILPSFVMENLELKAMEKPNVALPVWEEQFSLKKIPEPIV